MEVFMTVDINKVLKYADSKHRSKPGSPKYSMGYPARLGPKYMDCSSFVYYALKAGGWESAIDYIGNTETLYKEPNLKEIYSYDEVQAGDIFITGLQGTSGGAGGHTGIFYKKDGIVHCNYSNNGVSYNDMDEHIKYFLKLKRSNRERYFRPIPQASKPKAKATGGYVTDFAKAVIAGKYGTGQARVDRIYKAVQDEVNKLVKGQKGAGNYATAMAKDVIAGKYGNGNDRKQRLYKVVQDEVNRLV